MHGMQEKVSIIVVRYGQTFQFLGSRFGITRRSLAMPNRDPCDGNFRSYLTPIKDTYNLLDQMQSEHYFLMWPRTLNYGLGVLLTIISSGCLLDTEGVSSSVYAKD